MNCNNNGMGVLMVLEWNVNFSLVKPVLEFSTVSIILKPSSLKRKIFLYRSSRAEVLCERTFLKVFAWFTGHVWWNI